MGFGGDASSGYSLFLLVPPWQGEWQHLWKLLRAHWSPSCPQTWSPIKCPCVLLKCRQIAEVVKSLFGLLSNRQIRNRSMNFKSSMSTTFNKFVVKRFFFLLLTVKEKGSFTAKPYYTSSERNLSLFRRIKLYYHFLEQRCTVLFSHQHH